MESLSSEKLPIVWHTLEKLEETVRTLQSRTTSIQSVNEFLSSPLGMEKLDAACMVIIAIGEGVKNLDKLTEGKLLPLCPTIPWDKVMGARDVIAHHYFEVDAEVVFNIVKNDLDPLLKAFSILKTEIEHKGV